MAEISVVKPGSGFTVTKPNSGFTVTTPEALTIPVGDASSTFTVSRSDSGFAVTTPTAQTIQAGTGAATFAVTTPDSGFTITSPASQTIAVGNPSSSIEITNSPIAITITTGGIQTGGDDVVIDQTAFFDTATLTTSTTNANQVVDSWAAAVYRSAKYQIQLASGSSYHTLEMLVVHNGTTASQTTYADLYTNVSLADFAVDISGGMVRLLTTPTNATTTYKVLRTALVV
jgi:hypothetical protein